jgi:hypothetical protein
MFIYLGKKSRVWSEIFFLICRHIASYVHRYERRRDASRPQRLEEREKKFGYCMNIIDYWSEEAYIQYFTAPWNKGEKLPHQRTKADRNPSRHFAFSETFGGPRYVDFLSMMFNSLYRRCTSRAAFLRFLYVYIYIFSFHLFSFTFSRSCYRDII